MVSKLNAHAAEQRYAAGPLEASGDGCGGPERRLQLAPDQLQASFLSCMCARSFLYGFASATTHSILRRERACRVLRACTYEKQTGAGGGEGGR